MSLKTLTEMSCRLCFSSCSSKSINISAVFELYYELTGYKINSNNIPRKICPGCLEKLSIIQSFKEMCEKSEKLLEQFRNDVKNEEEVIYLEENTEVKLEIEEEGQELDPIQDNLVEYDDSWVKKLPKNVTISQKPQKKVVSDVKTPTTREYRSRERPQKKKWQYVNLSEHLREQRIDPSKDHLFILEYETKHPMEEFVSLPVNKDPTEYREGEDSVISCTYCSFQGVKRDFRQHFKEKRHKNVFRDTASCEFYCPDAMRYHFLKRHGNKRVLYRPLQCNFCQFQCFYETTIEKHAKKMHSEISKREICSKCGTIFFCDDIKLQLIVFRCNNGDKTLQIPFSSVFGKEIHISPYSFKAENQENSQITCTLYGKNVNKAYLKAHVEKYHENIRYTCDICGKSYSDKQNLSKHMKFAHLGGQDYLCSYCGRLFTNWTTHYIHIKTQHLKEFTYFCDLCDRRFINASKLKNHRLTHFDTRNFPCDQCSQRFKNSLRLTVHKRTIHSTKTYPCATCNKSFKNRIILRQHQKSHEPNKFFCPVCPLTFSVGFSLRSHVALKHPEYEMPPHGTVLRNVDINELKENLNKIE